MLSLADHLLEASMSSFKMIGDALLVPDDATVNAPFGWINERSLPAKGLTKEDRPTYVVMKYDTHSTASSGR